MLSALRKHWPEYLMEAFGLAVFMMSAGIFGTLLGYPNSWVHQQISDPTVRRALMGLAMGSTVILLTYYPWGQQSGAHYNPAVTLTFLRLGKIKPADAAFYMLAQFVGGIAGVWIMLWLLGEPFTSPPVQYVATIPRSVWWIVFAAELAISGLLMLMVLSTMNTRILARYTGIFAGCLVALYITIEDPISGMSMNPARSFASAFPGRLWESLWIYFLAPPLGMLLAVEIHRNLAPGTPPHCAKLNHQTQRRCIFCGFGMEARREPIPAATAHVDVTRLTAAHPTDVHLSNTMQAR